MKSTIAIILSSVAIIVAGYNYYLSTARNPWGDSIEKYELANPLDAYKSLVEMELNKDFLALIQYQSAISYKKNREKLDTLKVQKEREFQGKKLLFVEYTEAGIPKREVVALEKEASSGYWFSVYVSSYKVKETNAALAAEMDLWEESK